MYKKKEKKDKEPKQIDTVDLEEALTEIKQRFGEGSIMRLSESGSIKKVDVIPTGSVSLDLAIGVGGVPRGRVIEIYGPESSGKTTLALHIIAESQRKGGVGVFIDAEHALDPEYAQRIGVNIQELLISQPDSGEQALHILETLVRSGKVDVIVVDSVAALTPKNELAGEMGEFQIGLQARLMSSALRKLSGIVSKTNTCVIFLNQIRMKIGVMFGNPETTPGGLALKFFASLRIELRRAAQIKQGEQITGSRIRAKIVKNKVAPPFKTCEFDIFYNEGISAAADILAAGIKQGVVQKAGSWLQYGDLQLGQGMEQARGFLKENGKTAQEIRELLLASPQ
ncbi:MAG: recombinase RecA [bacterium]|nr:recombinase RecA [bacterium]